MIGNVGSGGTINAPKRSCWIKLKAALMSLTERNSIAMTEAPIACAPTWTCFRTVGWLGCLGSTNTPTRAKFGTAAYKYSRYLLLTSIERLVRPVMFPPGWAMLLTKPLLTGFPTPVMTMGIVFVACCAASTANDD